MATIPASFEVDLEVVDGGFDSSFIPLSPESGGSQETISWYAPYGVINGAEIHLSSSNHEIYPPDRSISIGFGEGWMKNSALGKEFENIISSSGYPVEYESGIASKAGRFLYEDEGGYRWLRSLTQFPESGEAGNPGFINFDTGRNLTGGDTCYMFSKAKATFIRPEDQGKPIQIKCERIGQNKNISGSSYNSAYLKQDYGSSSVSVMAYEGDTPNSYGLSDNGLQSDGIEISYGWLWNVNTAGSSDGSMRVLSSKSGSVKVSNPGASSHPNSVVKAEFEDRPRWLKVQDFVGNNYENAIGLEILRTDIFWQINGSMVVITDSMDFISSTVVEPLVFVRDGVYRLWAKNLDIRNSFIHLLSKESESIVSVPIGDAS